jgi:ribosome modulation factor
MQHPPTETADDPRAEPYDRGFGAALAGRTLADNPYPPDTAGHLGWENGWVQAMDVSAAPRPGPAR